MRAYYIMFYNNPILQPLAAKLDWTHYTLLFSIKDINEIKYYIDLSIKYLLTKRQLSERIRNNEYKKLSIETKQKLIDNKKPDLIELVINPIVINNSSNKEIILEKELHKVIMEDINNFLYQFGNNYMFVGDEYKFKMGDRYYKIDFFYIIKNIVVM